MRLYKIGLLGFSNLYNDKCISATKLMRWLFALVPLNVYLIYTQRSCTHFNVNNEIPLKGMQDACLDVSLFTNIIIHYLWKCISNIEICNHWNISTKYHNRIKFDHQSFDVQLRRCLIALKFIDFNLQFSIQKKAEFISMSRINFLWKICKMNEWLAKSYLSMSLKK